jgi:anchored repeat ABC transporter substrate-binding protein
LPALPLSRAVAVGASLLAAALPAAGCTRAGAAGGPAAPGAVEVVTTTGILADLVREVGGERVAVTALVPPGADPHSYEPVPADAARIARAEVAVTNHLLLEPQALVKAIDSNVPPAAVNVSLAENSEAYGAHLIPLVEDLGVDVVWLGLRVRGAPGAAGTDRGSRVELRATGLEGPGRLVVYLTRTLGDPLVYVDSGDGLGDADAITLPPGAHTHVNWAFTAPGVYRLTLAARVLHDGRPPADVGSGEVSFAVGADPAGAAADRAVLTGGHVDVTADLDRGAVHVYEAGGPGATPQPFDAPVIEVPDRARVDVPADARFAFLGAPGGSVHQLPQAVLGRHVHGEIDPHLWEDVRNAAAYVQLIRDALVRADPGHAQAYGERAARYLERLDDLHAHVAATVARIPPERRKLVTTHDAFGYLAAAYGLEVAGFVVPNPAQEPGASEVRQLSETVRRLGVPAVFVEPGLLARASVLEQVARDAGVAVCKLYGDSLDAGAPTYVDMMRHNAGELLRCLGGTAAGGPVRAAT